MKTTIGMSIVGVLVSAGLGACAVQAGQAGDSEHGAAISETSEAVTTDAVNCGSTCSGVTGAVAISKSCVSTCSATSSSVTCDGVVTSCVAPPKDAGSGTYCTPGHTIRCCTLPNGCGCEGFETCNASGTAYGPCEDQTPRGSVCQ